MTTYTDAGSETDVAPLGGVIEVHRINATKTKMTNMPMDPGPGASCSYTN